MRPAAKQRKDREVLGLSDGARRLAVSVAYHLNRILELK